LADINISRKNVVSIVKVEVGVEPLGLYSRVSVEISVHCGLSREEVKKCSPDWR
jgi:hypothetical protein